MRDIDQVIDRWNSSTGKDAVLKVISDLKQYGSVREEILLPLPLVEEVSSGLDLRGFCFENLKLDELELYGFSLEQTQFLNIVTQALNLSNTTLSCSSFRTISAEKMLCNGSKARGASFIDVAAKYIQFMDSDLSKSHFDKITCRQLFINSCNLLDATFDSIEVETIHLMGCSLNHGVQYTDWFKRIPNKLNLETVNWR